MSLGARLGRTVVGGRVLAPGEASLWGAVTRADPSLDHISPASLLAEPDAIVRLHAEAGVATPVVTRESWRMPLGSADAFWPVIIGTSNRGVFEALPEDARARVKHATIDRLRAEGVDALDMDALVAVARK